VAHDLPVTSRGRFHLPIKTCENRRRTQEDTMLSDSTLTALAVVGIALFAVVVALLVVFAVVEARRWLRAFGDVRRIGLDLRPGRLDDEGAPLARPVGRRSDGRVEITFRSKLDVIDEEQELRPFLRQLVAEGRRDEAIQLYQAFKGADAAEAEAGVDALARAGG
jgi:hypothetical protein